MDGKTLAKMSLNGLLVPHPISPESHSVLEIQENQHSTPPLWATSVTLYTPFPKGAGPLSHTQPEAPGEVVYVSFFCPPFLNANFQASRGSAYAQNMEDTHEMLKQLYDRRNETPPLICQSDWVKMAGIPWSPGFCSPAYI
jgi:hypothetical protein